VGGLNILAVSLIAFALLVLAAVFVYFLAGLFSAKGKHTELARKPFTGGLLIPSKTHKYYTDMLIFVALFLLTESFSILILFLPFSHVTLAFLLIGFLGLLLPMIISYRGR